MVVVALTVHPAPTGATVTSETLLLQQLLLLTPLLAPLLPLPPGCFLTTVSRRWCSHDRKLRTQPLPRVRSATSWWGRGWEECEETEYSKRTHERHPMPVGCEGWIYGR